MLTSGWAKDTLSLMISWPYLSGVHVTSKFIDCFWWAWLNVTFFLMVDASPLLIYWSNRRGQNDCFGRCNEKPIHGRGRLDTDVGDIFVGRGVTG